jgi:pRiA4b ORF-3-like protein
MAETDRHEPQIYPPRVVLRGISPLIWRRLLVRSDSTVAQLHEVLQVAFGWDGEHLNGFEIRGREYSVYRDGGGIIGIDATKVRLCDLKLRRLEQFVYEYDFGDSWIHDLRLETTLPVKLRNTYPLCVAGKCSAPPEDCGDPSHSWRIATTTPDSAAGNRPTISTSTWTNSTMRILTVSMTTTHRFDRRQVNRALSKLATGSYAEALDEIHNPGVDRIPRRAATQRPDPDH